MSRAAVSHNAGDYVEEGSNGLVLWFRQLRVMTKKNVLALVRDRRSTIVQLLVPILLVILLFLVDIGIKSDPDNKELSESNRFPTPLAVGDLAECIRVDPYGTPLDPSTYTCITVAYTPENDPVVDAIIDNIKTQNGITRTRGFATPAALDEYLFANKNSTQGAYNFRIGYNGAASIPNLQSISYTLQYNKTDQRYQRDWIYSRDQVLIPYVRAVNRAVLQFADDNSAAPSGTSSFDFNLLPYPHPAIEPQDSVGSFGSIFFFGALMFNIVMQLSQIVGEREQHLRTSMHQMGLSVSVYWCSYAIVNLCINVFSALLLILAGSIFQFEFFLKTDFRVYFMLFFCFGLSLVTLVFLLSCFVSRARTGTILGFAMFLIGMLVQSVVSTIFKSSTNIVLRLIFIIQPWALLARGMDVIGMYAQSSFFNGMEWSQREDGFMFPGEVMWMLCVDALIFLVLAIYLDAVLPDENGMSQSCFFFLNRGYWCPTGDRVVGSVEPSDGSKRSHKAGDTDANTVDDSAEPLNATDDAAAVAEQVRRTKAGEDPDVLAEIERVRTTLDVNYPVRIDGLGKTYYGMSCFCCRQPERDFQAVKEVNLILDKNSLFCLLGHNGAGKSTTISMMTGLLGPTAGDARVLGYSITTGMHQIKKRMGVCPQHDVLFKDLTAAEHLELFASFKNVPSDRIEAEVRERLQDVDLLRFADTSAGLFSGGMKRRLSVAIALIGNPAIVYLDEPTTGMDHVAARQVWDLIEKVKYDRVTVLTTHSMEEADVLGDRIGIMKEGKLICLGTSIRLKNKFGTGYRVSVFVDGLAPAEDRKARMKAINVFFKEHIAEVAVDALEASVIRFKVPRAATHALTEFLGVLEKNVENLGITDIQTSLTTLEQVFMAVGALGDDHADSRFGVSSQVGTELSKALVRLGEIREIQARRRTDPYYNPVHGDANAVLVEIDNSPAALEVEMVQLLEIEQVSLKLEQIKLGFERNRYTAFDQGTPDQRQQWANARLVGAHLTPAAIGPAAAAAYTLDPNASQPIAPPGDHPTRVSPAGVELAVVGGGDAPAPAYPGSPSTDEVYEQVSAEMATDQETVIKEYLRINLVAKKRGCNCYRKWKKISLAKKICWSIVAVIVIILIASIAGAAAQSSSDENPRLPIFYGSPDLASLPQNAWVEIVPDDSAGASCVRGDQFSYFVYNPAADKNPNKNVLFQLGGRTGVCYDEATCNSAVGSSQIDVTVDIDRANIRYRNLTGIWQKNGYNDAQFNEGNPNPNPFTDYLHIYVPLCSADAHWGNADVSYAAGLSMKHSGGVNANTAFTWLTEKVYRADATPATTPATTSIVAVGTGAGAWGAALWSANLRSHYDGLAHVFYLGDSDTNLVDVGTSIAKMTPVNYTPGLASDSTDAVDYYNSVFEGSTSVRATLWGLEASPARPAAITTPLPADFTVESALATILTSFTTDYTVLRTHALFPAQLLAFSQRSAQVEMDPVTTATIAVATPLQMAITEIASNLPDNLLAINATHLEDTGFILRDARMAGTAVFARGVCDQIGVRDAALVTLAPAATARIGSFATDAKPPADANRQTRLVYSSVITSPLFFSASSLADATRIAVAWVADSITARAPNTPVAAVADCNTLSPV
jgi:ABC-type multidrug transport system ATPase subunit